MLDQIAEKYGLSKGGILIMLALAVAIPLALLIPSPNKPRTIRVGNAQAPTGAVAQAPVAAAPAPSPAPAPAPAPVAAAVATVPVTPGRIRREDPFASILPKATPTVQAAGPASGGGPLPGMQPVDFPGAPLPASSFMQYSTPDFMPVVEPTFQLAGIYMSSTGRTVAIINDVKVGVGDSLGETGYKVDSIDSQDMKQVTLKNSAGRSVTLDFGRPPSELVPAPAGRQPVDNGGNP